VISIKVDPDRCQGYGNCVLALPSVFDVDETGQVMLLQDRVDDGELEGVRQAAYDCPTDSITFTETG
jgi:ferredoxin